MTTALKAKARPSLNQQVYCAERLADLLQSLVQEEYKLGPRDSLRLDTELASTYVHFQNKWPSIFHPKTLSP